MLPFKSLVKRCFHAVAPRAAVAVESARARAHSHRVIAGWGCPAVNAALVARFGDRVLAGPFQGLTLTPMTHKEQLGPYLLGLYEGELHPVWERVFQGHYPQILDVGAKFGYYAVGLARRFPDSRVVAFDTDPWARKALREMVAANGVKNVAIRGYCDPNWLIRHLEPGALILSDCEGYEGALFCGAPIAGLGSATMIIETHEVFVPGTNARLRSVLGPAHRIEEIAATTARRPSPVDLGFLDARQRDLATQEVRPAQVFFACTPRSSPGGA